MAAELLRVNENTDFIGNVSLEKHNGENQQNKYGEDTAGSIMNNEFACLKEEMTIKEAIDYTRTAAKNNEAIDTCFVIDSYGRLKGSVTLKDLILNDEDTVISSVMNKDVIRVNVDDDQEKASALFKEYDLLAMPVIDNEGKVAGIITVDDIVDVIEQENTEDFQKMAAIVPNEEPYLDTSVMTLAKHRIIWLLVLMISATITGYIIQGFEDVISSVVILASFIPMLMDTGGNAGSQSATLVIRGLALGEIKTKDFLRVVYKEFRVSIIVASVLAIVNFLRICIFTSADKMVAATVCLSLFFTVIIAKVIGGILPIISKKLKFDPAIMASPLITTVVDTFALLVYFGFARMLLGI